MNHALDLLSVEIPPSSMHVGTQLCQLSAMGGTMAHPPGNEVGSSTRTTHSEVYSRRA